MARRWVVMVGVFALSFVMSGAYSQLAKRLAWFDRDIHGVKSRQVPTGGGWVIFVSFWLGVFALRPDFWQSSQLKGIFLASALVLLTGILDDMFAFSPWQKSLGILLAANGVYFVSDISFSSELLPFFHPILNEVMVYLFTIVWIFIGANAINLIDGLDGLASSVTLVSLTTLTLVLYCFSQSISSVIWTQLIMLIVALLGFLPWNWYPARVYLGDTGALFIGFMYGVLTVSHLKNASFYTLLVPALIYAVPLFDTLYAIIRRLASGQAVLQGDRLHIHHRLLQLGLEEWQVVLIMVAITLVFSFLAILTQIFHAYRHWILLAIVLLFIGLVGLMKLSLKKGD